MKVAGDAAFPPQARGWTAPIQQFPNLPPVSPAGAGMDPRSRSAPRRCGCFPRRRGDGPSASCAGGRTVSFPPQARGWTPDERHRQHGATVSPAGAGMDPSGSSATFSGSGFPRRRGDGPRGVPAPRRPARFPPQARGWTPAAAGRAVADAVSPAGAGMDRRRSRRRRGRGGFPRRRGDGPHVMGRAADLIWFPPQARGWTAHYSAAASPSAVSPAGAGMDRIRAFCARAHSGFPRRRGDGPHRAVKTVNATMFPPQARGWTVGYRRRGEHHGVSPAGAGMDPPHAVASRRPDCFPRRRGDGPPMDSTRLWARMFPPQARGWTALVIGGIVREQVSPAGAGMDLSM